MTPRDIVVGLRGAGLWPMLPRPPCTSLRTLPARIPDDTSLDLFVALDRELRSQRNACIEFLRSEFQPWQPARCVIGDEIDEMLASAWPDADPVTLGLLRGTLQTAAVVASMRLLVLLAAEGRA